MRLLKPSYQILGNPVREDILKRIEFAGRTCYKSEDKITEDSAEKFVKMIIKRGHESVLEHESISVKFIVDRGVMAELTRHRIASFSIASTRYIDYSKIGLEFVIPPWVDIIPKEYKKGDIIESEADDPQQTYLTWAQSMFRSESDYISLLDAGWTPQQARSVLPNSLKTEIVCTTNIREWRHILKLRTSKAAHPQMREIMCPLLADFQQRFSPLFDGIDLETE